MEARQQWTGVRSATRWRTGRSHCKFKTAKLRPSFGGGYQNAREETDQGVEEYEKSHRGADTRPLAGPGIVSRPADKLARTASAALIYASGQWKVEEYSPPETKSDSTKTPESKDAAVEPPAKDLTTRAVERFLCFFYLNIILVPLRRLQTLILAMAGVFVLVLISYSSYPFESRESFHVLLISIFFVISLVVGIVYGQMYANPLLSRITNTKPGELGLDFGYGLEHLFSYLS